MNGKENRPEISIVIPTLNEVEALPLLLVDLASQQGVAIEVLVSDGGSHDGTGELAAAILARHHLAGVILTGTAGRGRQLNRGAALARGEWLLFLHADSRLPAPAALAESLAALRREENPHLAGRFSLRFDLHAAEHTFDYYLCEVKARFDLPGTIHGDQGMLMTQAWFHELGGFREDLPVLEDTLLAEVVRKRGGWRLLPAAIITSPRRFQVEGFRERQLLNALLTNFAMIGWDEPLHRAPEVYISQDRTGRLDPAPFFRLVDECLRKLPVSAQRRIWRRTGAFVRANAWQLALRRTARRAFAARLPPEAVPLEPVHQFRRRFDFLTGHPCGSLAAALVTWLWFRTRCRSSFQGA